MISTEITIEPIGVVSTNLQDSHISQNRKTLLSDSEISPRYQKAIEGLDLHSHIFVLFWTKRRTQELILWNTHERTLA